MTAQQLFDAIKAGDETLRAKVNRKAAEACGYVSPNSSHGDSADEHLWCEYCKVNAAHFSQWCCRYTRDLNAVAGLPIERCVERMLKGTVSMDYSIWEGYHRTAYVLDIKRADEALARAVCWYVATGGGE